LGEDIDLSNLKICLAHFGGSDEWDRYLSNPWSQYHNNISHGTEEEYSKYKNTLNHGSRDLIWKDASWLCIIYDLIVKYDHVYTDISFLLHNEDLFPTLKYILLDEKVSDRILFGTDFYVVSQKAFDKELHIKLRSYLGEELFKKIAIDNPKHYLETKL